MIVGIGTDIIEIERFKRISGKESLMARLFTPGEIAYYIKRGQKPETLAGRFAAKEAVCKCLKTGFSSFWPNMIEITEDGAPGVTFHGKAREYADALGITAVHLSISHGRETAVAFAVAVDGRG